MTYMSDGERNSINEVSVEVNVRVGEVDISGREYKVSHVILFGQSETYIELEPYNLFINAIFDTLPYTRYERDELVVLGSKEDSILLQKAKSLLRCEIDRSVTVKIGSELYSLEYVRCYTRKPIIVNAVILWPLLLSILAIDEDIRINAKTINDKMIIEI